MISQIDCSINIYTKHREKCSWSGYRDIYEGIRNYLFNEPIQQPAYKNCDLIDNLHVIIFAWNNETDMLKTINGGNPMKEWLDSHNIVILPEYLKYFKK